MTASPPATSGGAAAALRPLDERLLRVALLPPARATAEWDDLRHRFTPTDLDDGRSVQLLPMVGYALARAGSADPELARLRGIRRHAFANNHLLMAMLGDALDVLAGAGVRSLALKGLPLAMLHYPGPSVRSMYDADILVPPSEAATAMAALHEAGWHSTRQASPDLLRRWPEVGYRSPAHDTELDLHWRLVPWVDRAGTGSDAELWARARPLDIAGRTTLAPSPEDLLLHVVLHAYRSGWAAVPRWVPDVAAIVVSTGARFDWGGFVARVRRGRLVPPVRDALHYVARTFEVPVPAGALDTLAATRVSVFEQRRYAAGNRLVAGERRPVVGQYGDLRVVWSRHTLNRPITARLRYLRPFLLARTGAPNLRSVPATVRRHRSG